MPVDVIVFDFDGVILDSVEIKTRTFGELFKDFGPEAVKYVKDYHRRHGGVSRYVKFRHYYDKLLGRDITPEEMDEMDRRFNEIALEQLSESPLLPGVRQFLEYGFEHWPMYVASGAPEKELTYLLELFAIKDYFKGIYGSPPPKSENLATIIGRENADPGKVLMVGDSSTDLQAAEANGTLFLGVGDFHGRPSIPDLGHLRKALERDFGA
jgi:HAD superfamily hydrolase (TIGR01549 family)